MSERETEMYTCCTCGYQWRRGQSGDHSCTRRLVAKVDELENWKAEATGVLNSINPEAVAKALRLPLGTAVGPAILPGIQALQQGLTDILAALPSIQHAVDPTRLKVVRNGMRLIGK